MCHFLIKNKIMRIEENEIHDEEQYCSPDLNIVEIVFEQNFFAGSGNAPNFDGEDW